MMTEDGFEQMIQALQARGLSRETAEDYAARMGDCIEEEDGKWIIRDDQGEIMDRIEPIE